MSHNVSTFDRKSTNDMLKRIAALAATLALSVGPAGLAAASDESPSPSGSVTPAQQLSPYIEPSIVAVYTEWSGTVYDKAFGRYLRDAPFVSGANCTGFVLSEDGYIGTAGHCVVTEPDTKYSVMLTAIDWALENGIYGNVSRDALITHAASNWVVDAPEAGKKNTVDRTVDVSWNANVSGIDVADGLPARVIGAQKLEQGDSALLKVEADDLIPLPLVDEDLETGTEIAAVGFPGTVDDVVDVSYTPSIKTGTVSSEKTVGGGLLKVYEIDAAVSPGMSGGPTVTYDGEVVGINSFKPTEETQSFNFIQPTSNLQELLASAGAVAELGELGEAYRSGLDAYFSGDKAAAIENLEQVVDQVPSNKFADEYLEKAEDMPEPEAAEEDSGGVSVGALVGLAVVGLLVLGGVLYFLLVRGRKKSSDGPTAMTGVVTPHSSDTASDSDTRPEPVERFCGHCGYKNHGDRKYCESCGKPM